MIERTREIALPTGHAEAIESGPPDGPMLVVVPPLGMNAELMRPLREALDTRLHVVIVELPGSGTASRLGPTTTTRELGDDLATVIASLSAGPTNVLAISFGGFVAQWTAIDHGERIATLVLASTAAQGLDVALSGPARKLAIARALLGPESVRAELAREIETRGAEASPAEAARIESAVDSTPRPSRELLFLVAAALRHDSREALAGVTARTLVLSGGQDALIPIALQDDLARRIHGAERVIVAGAGHDVTSEEPRRVADEVLRFLGA